MSISNYLENKLLDTLRGNAFSVATVYAKLHTGDPGEDGTANAATETSRKVIAFAAPAGGSEASNVDVDWLGVAANETYSHISLWDSVGPAGGNCLWTGAMTNARTMQAGDNFRLASGQVTLTLD